LLLIAKASITLKLTPEGIMLDAAEEGRAAAQGMQAAEDVEAVAKPKPIIEEAHPGEPVQERIPVEAEKPQPAVEQSPAHEAHAEAAAEARAIEVQEVLDYNAQYKTQAASDAQKLNVEILEDKRPHIFAAREGHAPWSAEYEHMLLDMASDQRNYFAQPDQYGSLWCEKILDNGTQLWCWIRKGKIRDAGINIIPRKWDSMTGLCNPLK
jgi:hypothetical protein